MAKHEKDMELSETKISCEDFCNSGKPEERYAVRNQVFEGVTVPYISIYQYMNVNKASMIAE